MSLSIILFPKKYSDGKFPVMLRCIIDRTPKYKKLFTIEKENWDPKNKNVKKSHELHRYLNLKISKALQECEERWLSLEDNGDVITHDAILGKKKVIRKQSEDFTLRELGDKYLKEKRAEVKASTYLGYVSRIDQIMNAVGHIRSSEVTRETSLLLVEFEKEAGNNNNTIKKKITTLNQILNWAKIVVKTKNYLKKQNAKKGRVSMDDMELLKNPPFEISNFERQCLDVIFMQYYTYGSRVSDMLLLKQNNIYKDRVEFEQLKTGALVTVKRHAELNALIMKYKDPNKVYFFSFMEHFMVTIYPNIANDQVREEVFVKFLSSKSTTIRNGINKVYKRFNKVDRLKTHMMRHTFARNAKDMDVDIRHIQKALGHRSVQMTEVYLEELSYDDIHVSMNEVYAEPKKDKELPLDDIKEAIKGMTLDDILKLVAESNK
jgi:integrase/recombinase XerD